MLQRNNRVPGHVGRRIGDANHVGGESLVLVNQLGELGRLGIGIVDHRQNP